MNDLQIFKNAEFGSIRVIEKDGEPWLVGKDVSDALGYDQTSNMVKRLDSEDFMSSKLDGMNMKSIMINESGFYAAVLGSHLPTAKKFKRWVTSEVLPAIRKHGAYMTPAKIEEVLLNPDVIINLATRLKEEQALVMKLEAKMFEDRPKVIFADSVTASEDSILVGEMAKLLKQNGFNTGQNRFYALLREQGFLIKRKGSDYNLPTQKSIEMGLFEIKETAIAHSDGRIKVEKTAKVTGKGQLYFMNRFKPSVDIAAE